MVEKRWLAEDFEKLPVGEQDQLFDDAVQPDLGSVDPAFVSKIRQRISW